MKIYYVFTKACVFNVSRGLMYRLWQFMNIIMNEGCSSSDNFLQNGLFKVITTLTIQVCIAIRIILVKSSKRLSEKSNDSIDSD